jgi:hypothetical protein
LRRTVLAEQSTFRRLYQSAQHFATSAATGIFALRLGYVKSCKGVESAVFSFQFKRAFFYLSQSSPVAVHRFEALVDDFLRSGVTLFGYHRSIY